MPGNTFKINFHPNLKANMFSHHFLELLHFEVIDPLRATHSDLLSGQKTSSLMSLKDGVREQLSNLVWIWNWKS